MEFFMFCEQYLTSSLPSPCLRGVRGVVVRSFVSYKLVSQLTYKLTNLELMN